MRVGIITGEYPPMQGGVGDYSREISRALTALGHEVFVLTDHRAQPAETDNNVTVQPSVVHWGRWGNKRGVRPGFRQAQQWATDNRLDVINIQYQAAAYNMHGAANDLPNYLHEYAPVVTTFHDLMVPYLFPKAGPLRKRAVYKMAQQSNAVIVTNSADELELQAVGSMPPTVARIPIGSNIAVQPPDDYDPQQWRSEKLHVPENVLLVGYFGFINATKGVDTLAHAVRLLTEADINVELLVIGGQTGDSDATNVEQADVAERLIGGLGISRRVRWTGFVEAETVSAHLLACDMIALPYKDGVSLRRGTLMAALAHGCPIVTTFPQDTVNELKDQRHVFMVPPEDPQALADALVKLRDDTQLCTSLGNAARNLAQQFDWEPIAAQVNDVLLAAIADYR